jgi:hypothetical protein
MIDRVTSEVSQPKNVLDATLKNYQLSTQGYTDLYKTKSIPKNSKKAKLVPHPAKIDTNFTTNNQRRFVNE